MTSLVVVGFSMLWIVYNLANLPFRQAYQNYRANIVHVSQLVILMVGNYYDSMLETELLETKAYKFRGAEIQMIALYVSVGFSAVCLVYDVCVFVKEKVLGKTNKKKSSSYKKSKSKSPVESLNENLPAIQSNFT